MKELKLFPDFIEPTNILLKDGEAIYFGSVLNLNEADHYLHTFLENISWKNDRGITAGKSYVSERKIAWFDEKSSLHASIARSSLWKNEIRKLITLVESYAHTQFNACLFNLYATGKQGVGWHCDEEAQQPRKATIASLSLGAERRFDFRHIHTNETVSITLEHGSLLIMRGVTQHFWKHQLAKTAKISDPRINLTFRQTRPTRQQFSR